MDISWVTSEPLGWSPGVDSWLCPGKNSRVSHSKGKVSLSKSTSDSKMQSASDAEDEALILWPPGVRNRLTGKDPDAGKDWRSG